MADGITKPPPDPYTVQTPAQYKTALSVRIALVARMEQAGCTTEARDAILAHLVDASRDQQTREAAEKAKPGEPPVPVFFDGQLRENQLAKLEKIANFMETIGQDGTKRYCSHLLTEGKQPFGTRRFSSTVAKPLLDDSVLDQAKLAYGLTKVASLDDFLAAVKITGAAKELSDPKVLRFAIQLGSFGAGEYFRAIWGTGEVKILTDKRILDSAEGIRPLCDPEFKKANLAIDLGFGYFRSVAILDAVAEMTDPAFLKWYAAHPTDSRVDFPQHLVEPMIRKSAERMREMMEGKPSLAKAIDVEKAEDVLSLTSAYMDSAMAALLRLLKSGSREEKVIAGNALYRRGGPFVESSRDQIEAELQTIYPTSQDTLERSKSYIEIAKTFGRKLAAEFGENKVVVTVIGSAQKGLAAKGSDIDCNAYIFTDRKDDEATVPVSRASIKLR